MNFLYSLTCTLKNYFKWWKLFWLQWILVTHSEELSFDSSYIMHPDYILKRHILSSWNPSTIISVRHLNWFKHAELFCSTLISWKNYFPKGFYKCFSELKMGTSHIFRTVIWFSMNVWRTRHIGWNTFMEMISQKIS